MNINGCKKKKIAFVSPRYGMDVNGGAELYCRQLAEKLAGLFEVEVLTTCAIDYITWKDEYKEGAEIINGVTVRRFKVDRPRDPGKFNEFTAKVMDRGHIRSIDEEITWMKLQGPASSGLIRYLSENRNNYAFILFIPYLYYTTYFGMQVAPEKSILIPAAHDEPWIRLNIFKDMINLAKGIIYLTDEEKDFVNKLFNNKHTPSIVLGAGIDVPENIESDRFRKKYGIFDRFILYIGRIDESKGCKTLFDYFIKYKEENKSELKLVLIGKSVMKIPNYPDILPLGFVSDTDKFDGIAASDMIVLPSEYESLSIAVLESMKVGRPVLVNGNCEVLRGHCIKSNAGLYYKNYEEFSHCLSLLNNDDVLREKMGINGVQYVNKQYDWKVLIDKLSKFLLLNV